MDSEARTNAIALVSATIREDHDILNLLIERLSKDQRLHAQTLCVLTSMLAASMENSMSKTDALATLEMTYSRMAEDGLV